MLQGHWQSCLEEGEWGELVYAGLTWPGIPPFELHLGPQDEFALFDGITERHRDHAGPLNLLTAYRASDLHTWRGARRWMVRGLCLSVVQAGGGSDTCESYFVRLTRNRP